jgi:hypothetical protein
VVAGATSGLVVGYSPEYGPPSGQGEATLERARDLTDGVALDPARPVDAFSHDLPAAEVQTPLWPWLTLAALLLLPFDVAVRRLAIGRRELTGLRAGLRRGPASVAAPRPTHATVLLQDQRRRADRRTDAKANVQAPARASPVDGSPTQRDGPASDPASPSQAGPPVSSPPASPGASARATTSSLLAAKRRAGRGQAEERPED